MKTSLGLFLKLMVETRSYFPTINVTPSAPAQSGLGARGFLVRVPVAGTLGGRLAAEEVLRLCPGALWQLCRHVFSGSGV